MHAKKILILLVALILVTGMSFAEKTKVSIYGGGFCLKPALDYDYSWTGDYAWEPFEITNSMTSEHLFGKIIGASLFITPKAEIYVDLNFLSKKMKGITSFELPGIFNYNDLAYKETEIEQEYLETIINIGAAYHFKTNAPIKPYIGGGLSIINAKLEIPEVINFTDIYHGTWSLHCSPYGLCYWDFEEDSHELQINEVKMVEKKFNIASYHLKAGFDFQVTPNLSFFAEGRYLAADTGVPIQIDAISSGERFFEKRVDQDNREFFAKKEKEFDINLGGLMGLLGIKIVF